jgi:4-hydroxy-tetrahydrodipicolinate synthase
MINPSLSIVGLWPALLSPVRPDGSLDLPRLIAHAKRLMEAGSDGLTLFGTTGEGTAFTVAQRMAATDALIAEGIPGQQLILNLTALARDDAIALAEHAVRVNAKAGLLMPPFYYNGQHDAGLMGYISEVIEATNALTGGQHLKVILYHFPGLTGVGFGSDAISQLMTRHPAQVVGLKDSSAQVAHSKALALQFPRLAVLVGCEPDVMPTLLVGGAGSICGLANIAPQLMRRMMDAPDQMRRADEKLMHDLLNLLTCQPGMPFVSAYKVMLAEQLGDDAWLHVRTPLTALTAQQELAVRSGYQRAMTDHQRMPHD